MPLPATIKRGLPIFHPYVNRVVLVSEADFLLQLPEPDLPHRVVRTLLQDEMSPLPRRQDVSAQVRAVDLVPYLPCHGLGGLVRERGVLVKVRVRQLEGRGPKQQKALDVPTANLGFRGVDVDAEVKEVGHENPRSPAGMVSLEDIQSF